MKIKFIFILAIILGTLTAAVSAQDKVHSPGKGSTERKAILDSLRTDAAVQFKVHFIKVHGGWAWTDTTPLDKNGRAVAEGGPNLLHLESGKWAVMDLSTVPEDPDDPMGVQDLTKLLIVNIRKTFVGVPADIFPKPSH